MASVSAAEDFRSGVQVFNNGLFDKAILYLEKSLTENPTDPRTKAWLARASYRSGFVESAIALWRNLVATKKGGPLVEDRLATVSFRAGLGRELSAAEERRYVVAQSLPGILPRYDLFLRPSSVTARPDGGYYVASFASNEVLELDANGDLERKVRGGLWGFDHPFDVLDPGNGYIYVSEFGSDRIARCAPDGGPVFRFGRRGLGAGELLGPQYMATDGKGYLYVTDVGNRRVSKFSLDGKFVLSFGAPGDDFPGFRVPSGIAVHDDKVFVADHDAKDIAVFDLSGNYLTTLAQGELSGPDGLSFVGSSGELLVSDATRILLYDVDTQAHSVAADLSGTATRIVKAVSDANGDLLAADFDASVIYVLSQYSAMYSGLSVQVDRVDSDRFPRVSVDVSVKTRLGSPFTGLDLRNFEISEGDVPVGDPKLVFKGMDAQARLAILVDRSPAMRSHESDIRSAVLDILRSLAGRGSFTILSAGANPVVEAGPNTERNTAAEEAAGNGTYSDAWRFDLGLRMAASELIPKQGKSAVVFITQGDLGASPFRQFSMNELLHYLQNNGIKLYTVNVDQAAEDSAALTFLTRQSGGESYYLYRPEGIGAIVGDILRARDGSYVFSYTSPSPSSFGTAYIPIEVEAHLFARSGRDEAGYYAPLQF